MCLAVTRRFRLSSLVFSLVLSLAACSAPAREAAEQFQIAAQSPPLLRAFLYQMPKGADLHTHLSGSAYAEGLIRAGAEAKLCVDLTTTRVSRPPCGTGSKPLAAVVADAALTTRLVSAWSMLGFVPSSGYDGHDHFFAAFGKFGGVAPAPVMAREVVNRAGAQRMRHIELMITFKGSSVADLADRVQARTPWTGDMAQFQAALLQAGLPALVRAGAQDAETLTRALRAAQLCHTSQREAGCQVSVRWIQQVTRTNPPWRVFAQTLFAGLLQRETSHVAGLNFVAPEDHPVALRDYSLHMRMIAHVRQSNPAMRVALHAGELRLGLVSPEHLTFHVREAVTVAGANRIGHGVSALFESDPAELLREMARQRVAVEINLTSNAQILGVTGADHPFPVYRAAGVPTVISTDDEGIERIDRTHELQRAVSDYRLSWDDLVGLERASLEYAFLPGASLWADPVGWRMVPACADAPLTDPGPACQAHLDGSERAGLQWSLERDLAGFRPSLPPLPR